MYRQIAILAIVGLLSCSAWGANRRQILFGLAGTAGVAVAPLKTIETLEQATGLVAPPPVPEIPAALRQSLFSFRLTHLHSLFHQWDQSEDVLFRMARLHPERVAPFAEEIEKWREDYKNAALAYETTQDSFSSYGRLSKIFDTLGERETFVVESWRDTFGKEVLLLEESLARDFGMSITELYQATELIISPWLLVQAAVTGSIDYEGMVNKYSDELRLAYLHRLAEFAPEKSLRIQEDQKEKSSSRYLRRSLFIAIQGSDHSQEGYALRFGFNNYHNWHSLEHFDGSIEKFARQYMKPLRSLETAIRDLNKMKPSKFRDQLIIEVVSLERELREELAELPQRVEQSAQRQHALSTRGGVVQDFANSGGALAPSVDWLRYLDSASRAAGIAYKFIEPVVVETVQESTCVKALEAPREQAFAIKETVRDADFVSNSARAK